RQLTQENIMSTKATETLATIDLERVRGGADAQATLDAIKGTGQLIGCARQAYATGLSHGNQGYTAGGTILLQQGKALSQLQQADLGLEACLKGAQDASNAQQQLGF